MKLRKVGQVVLALVVSLGFVFGVTSCSNSYTVGYLYVTGSQYNQISGFKIDNQTGKLTAIEKSPFGANGTNPVRALVLSGGRFLYVLNQGTFSYNSDGSTTGTASNISLFEIGGNGVLTFQASYASQGNNSLSILTDSSGTHLYVLDDYESTDSGTNKGGAIPSATAPSASTPCLNAADSRYYPTGDISAYTIDSNTGRLSLVTNAQVTNPDGTQLTYFPLGCFPTEFKLAGGYIFTIQQGGAANEFHTADKQTVFSYSQSSSNGQLTLTQNAPLQTNAAHLTYINTDPASKYVYLLDAGPVNCVSNTGGGSATTQILPYTISSGGSLATISTGNVCNDPTAVNPNLIIADSKSKFLYVTNTGPNTGITSQASEITAFTIDPTTGALSFIAGQPFTTGSAPRCLLEDPSNQFIYSANFNDSTVVGKIIDVNSGVLNPLRNNTSFATSGNPTWCVASGRTQ
jgi:6-phosphogluconolactonase (cycloisomerase 2 family)